MQNNNKKRVSRFIANVAGIVTILAGLITVYQFFENQASTSRSGVGASGSSIIYQSALTSSSSVSDWETDRDCVLFVGDGLHVAPNRACPSPVNQSGDVDVSVQMRQISGAPTDLNGVDVRRSGRDSANLYEFDIDAVGGWLFKLCFNDYQNCDNLARGSDSAINTELNSVNTIEVRAVGPDFTLLVNGTRVGHVEDSTLKTGGVWLETGGTAECVFTYFKASRST